MLYLTNIDNHPTATPTATPTPKTFKQIEEIKDKELRTLIIAHSKDDKRLINVETTAVSKDKVDKGLIKIEPKKKPKGKESKRRLKRKTTQRSKVKGNRRQNKKEGFLPICGIDSYEDDIYGCQKLNAVSVEDKLDETSAMKEILIKGLRIIDKVGTSSTDIIWLDGPPDEQIIPTTVNYEDIELCKGLAKCRKPFGALNASALKTDK